MKVSHFEGESECQMVLSAIGYNEADRTFTLSLDDLETCFQHSVKTGQDI